MNNKVVDAFALSKMQSGMYCSSELAEHDVLYQDVFSFRLACEWQETAFKQAIEIILSRHPVLRAAYDFKKFSQPLQLIYQHGLVDFEVLSSEPGDFDNDINEKINRLKHTRFDLSRPTQMRFRVIRYSADEFQLLINAHHIMLDGWSMATVITELLSVYLALTKDGNVADWVPPKATFKAFVKAEQSAQANQEHQQFWTEQLKKHEYSETRWRSGSDLGKKQTVTHLCSFEKSQQLQHLAAKQKVSLKTLLLSAHMLVCEYIQGSDNVHSTVVVNGRLETSGADRAVGLFVNSQPLLTDGHAASFAQQIAAVDAKLNCLQRHRRYPYAELVRQHGTPISDVSFNFVNFHVYEAIQGSERLQVKEVTLFENDNFSLSTTFNLMPSGQLQLKINFDDSKFSLSDAAVIERLYLDTLTAMLTSVEGSCQLSWESDLVNPLPLNLATPPELIHDYVAQCAEKFGNHIAISDEVRSLTYRQLNCIANSLSHALIAKGIRPESKVALCLERGIDQVLAILAILKAGGAYIPLDPSYPDERLAYILSDSKPDLVISDGIRLSAQEFDVFCQVDFTELKQYSGCDANPVVTGLGRSSLAYVIYTSGSTGAPKGVMVEHGNVIRLMHHAQTIFDFNEQDVWTMFHSFSFDFSVWEMWGALCFGGELLVVPQDCARSPEAFFTLLRSKSVTILNQTPSAFYNLIAVDQRSAETLNLRYVIFGGEALTPSLLSSWVDKYGLQSPALVNMYGITETTVHVTYKRLTADDLSLEKSNIGYPLPDLSVRIVSSQGHNLPPGAIGEMYIAGPGVARGYNGKPALTQDKFGVTTAEGERFYRSGDLARLLPTGELEYIGRADQQVKIRGFRIELSEVESKLSRYPELEDVVVIARDQPLRLVAFVKSRNEAFDLTKFESFMNRSLPNHMIPSFVMVLAAMPLTENGKVDKKALALQVLSGSEKQTTSDNKPNVLETQLSQIWEEVLNVQGVGLDQSFFNVGGDSIRALSVISRCADENIHFSVKDLFAQKTIRNLAALIASGAVKADAEIAIQPFGQLSSLEKSTLVDIYGERVEDAYPLSSLQKGMVFHHQLQPGKGTYHDVFSLDIKLNWSLPKFTKAVEEMMTAHHMLRATFHLEGEHGYAIIHEKPPVPLFFEDLRGVSSEAQTPTIQAWYQAEIKREIALDELLWSVHCHQLDNEHMCFHLSFHHALLDGWSVASLLSELFERYLSKSQGRAEKTYQGVPSFGEAVALEFKALSDEANIAFWQTYLNETETPWWKSEKRDETLETRFSLSHQQSQKIKQIAAQSQVQVKSLCLAVHQTFMRLISGQENLTTPTVFNTRPEIPGAQRTLGLFLNSLPVRITEPHGKTWAQMLNDTETQLQNVNAHRFFPLSEIQNLLQEDYASSLFNYTDFHAYKQVSDDIEVLNSQVFEKTNYQLEVHCNWLVQEQCLSVVLKLDSASFSKTQLRRYEQYLRNIFTALIEQEKDDIDLNQFLSTQERDMLLHEWNSTDELISSNTCIHQWFETQAAHTPDALAVRMGAESITYKELNERANQLAHYLRTRYKVKAGELVGVHLERSIDLVVAFWAILKTGAGYVPLDTGAPAARLQQVVQESKLLCVLVSESTQLPEVIPACSLLIEKELDGTLYPTNNLALPYNIKDTAYVIFTSGSTGTPKGVVTEHQALVNRIDWMQKTYQLKREDRVLQKTPVSFDVSLWELTWPFISGAGLVMLEPDAHKDPQKLSREIIKQQISVLHFVPSMFEQVLQHGEWQACQSVRLVLCSGEALPGALVKKHYAFHNARLDNLYGPTEAAIDVSQWHCVPDTESVPIGKPIQNTKLYVLDKQVSTLAPTGTPGELYIGGTGLARGYLNQPALTAQAFVTAPAQIGGRLYKTGDIARYNEDGSLDYLGRKDFQVKIRGVRIELEEIEYHLCSFAAIQSAKVVVVPGASNQGVLAAVVVLNTECGSNEGLSEIKSALAQKLPGSMFPARWVMADTIPVTANGKTDSKALLKLVAQSEREPLTPLSSDTQRRVGQFWSQLLNVDETELGRESNFYELGGSSLQLMPLLSWLNTQVGDSVSLNTLMTLETIYAMSNFIDMATADSEVHHTNKEREVFEL
ncbi:MULTISPECIES: non-ribosomal peptide synthetase [unclassified Pseudoalteromonas]|uniref:non-ribosomal peptide synthetase n=1 Tax=unclassified Pseudoalteromonas TaxID=194690 RepID=UPI0020968924|nr:non-ribosomal peptide synthetase [Pseudoalteromonas sp. XMcav2-N]